MKRSASSRRKRHWRLFLSDMIDSGERIAAISARHSRETFVSDRDAFELVAWHFQILGEASNHIPQDVADRWPAIHWRELRDMRNVIVHGYFHVNSAILWRTAIEDVPGLLADLKAIAAEADRVEA